MKIKVHRGLEQIGGCITEISTDTSRVFIDMGQNLPGNAEPTTPEEDKELVEGVFAQNKKEYEAVFYTHGHDDHIGLFMYVPDEVPQYMSDGTKEVILTKYQMVAESHKKSLEKSQDELTRQHWEKECENDKQKVAKLKNFITWTRPEHRKAPQSILVGDITVSPFYCNHSIFDSSMFLIEADGKRIWHTGDFRNTGFSGNLYAMLRKYAVNIDSLIIEGTMLNQNRSTITEKEVSDKMSHVMKAFKYVFVLCSATDVDRLAGIQRACELANKKLYVCSRFMYKTMEIFTNRLGIKRRLYHFEPTFFKARDLGKMRSDGFVIAVGTSQYPIAKKLRDTLSPSETLLIYSNWDGYYKIPEQIEKNKAYKNFRDLFPNVVDIHTSGHADRETLKRTIEIINPKEGIIGIHKDKDVSLSLLSLPEEINNKIL